MHAAEINDAELVAESLAGNREAFRRIVERYQTLISSVAYCATGSVSQSEDLAQETFVTAWKQLRELREPAKLRPWLCRIVRFLIGKEFRSQGREPVHAAESLEAMDEIASPEPLPRDHVISEEEKAILWRSLERIPEIYREPLVLFYREQQSIATVAQALDLSEDAVKQRLSRGRKLLHEQVLAFIEAALERTKPDKAFTLGVLAALPLVVTMAKAVTAGVAIKGGSTVKATTSLAMLGAILTASVLFEISLFAFLAFTGGCIGYMMGRACARSAQQLESVARFWRAVAAGFGVFLFLPYTFAICFRLPAETHPGLWYGMTLWLGVFYFFVPAVLAIWIWRWWRGLRTPEMAVGQPIKVLKKRVIIWLTLGIILPVGFLGISLYAVLSEPAWSIRFISEAQVEKLIAEHKDGTYRIDESKNGTKLLWVKLPESGQGVESTLALLARDGIVTMDAEHYLNTTNSVWMKLPETGRRVEFIIPADESTLALLKEKGIAYSTSVEGRDYEVLGLPGKLTWLLSFFIAPMGMVILLRRPWRDVFQPQEIVTRRDERAEKMAFKAFAVAIALVLLTVGVMLGLMTRWTARTISDAQAEKIITNFKGERFEVFQYNNGKRELWILQTVESRFHRPGGRGDAFAVGEGRDCIQNLCSRPGFWIRRTEPHRGDDLHLDSSSRRRHHSLVGDAENNCRGCGAGNDRGEHFAGIDDPLACPAAFHSRSAKDDCGTSQYPVGGFPIRERGEGIMDHAAGEQALSWLYRAGRRLHACAAGRK